MALTKTNLANIVEGILPVANGGTGTSTGPAAAGSTTQVQYNNAGAFGGSANMTYSTSGGMTVNGVTQGYNTTLYTVDGALSNYSASNGVYLNGNRGGWLGLQADGTQNTYIELYGSTATSPNAISFFTNTTLRMRVTSTGDVGIASKLGVGTYSPATCLDVVSATNGANSWAWFHSNTGGALPNSTINSGIMLGGNYSAGNSESNIMWGTGYNSASQYLAFSAWNNSTNTVTEQARITAAGLFYMNSGYGSSAPAYGCRAWVNFSGSSGSIRGSGGISSVTRTSVGTYTIAYSFTFPDTNYGWAFNGLRQSGSGGQVTPVVANTSSPSTTGMSIQASNSTSSSFEDYVQVVGAWFR